jgi:hypothetical protein
MQFVDNMVWEKINVENDIDGADGLAFNTMIYIQRGD